jgi:hypothetical protein
MVDRLLDQAVTPLEIHVESLNGVIADNATEPRTKMLDLEQTTIVKDDCQRKNARLDSEPLFPSQF